MTEHFCFQGWEASTFEQKADACADILSVRYQPITGKVVIIGASSFFERCGNLKPGIKNALPNLYTVLGCSGLRHVATSVKPSLDFFISEAVKLQPNALVIFSDVICNIITNTPRTSDALSASELISYLNRLRMKVSRECSNIFFCTGRRPDANRERVRLAMTKVIQAFPDRVFRTHSRCPMSDYYHTLHVILCKQLTKIADSLSEGTLFVNLVSKSIMRGNAKKNKPGNIQRKRKAKALQLQNSTLYSLPT